MAKKKAKATALKAPKAPRVDMHNLPTHHKDGRPMRKWSDIAEERIAKYAAREAAGEVEDRSNKCTAMTSGIHGPRHPCFNTRVRGMVVCRMHGGSAKQTKNAARRRMLCEIDPTISRLIEIRDQDDHLPSALGASVQILNRVLGKPGDGPKQGEASAPVINVGIAIGGIPARPKVEVTTTPAPAGYIEGDVDDDDDDDGLDGVLDDDDDS